MQIPEEIQGKFRELKSYRGSSSRINYLLDRCRELQYVEPHLAFYFSDAARRIARDSKLPDQETFCLRMNGICKFAAHEYTEAIQIFHKALSRYVRAKDWLGEAKAHQNIGAAYRAMGQVDKAEIEYRLTEAYARDEGDKELLMTVLNNLGTLFTTLNRSKEALEAYSECLSIAERLDNAVIRARITENIAEIYAFLGDEETGISWSQRSLALHRLNGDTMGIALTLSNLGRIYRSRGDIDDALEMLTESLNVMSRLKDDHSSARIMSDLGLALLEKGHVKQAHTIVNKAVSIFRKSNDVEREIRCIVSLADISRKMGNQQQSLKHLLYAKEQTKKIQNPVLLVDVEQKLADAANDSNQRAKAIEHLQTAVQLASTNLLHDLTAQLHRHLSDAYSRIGDWENALVHERMASEAQRTFDAEIRANHAKVLQIQLDLERLSRERERTERKNESLQQSLEQKEGAMNVNIIALTEKNELLAELMNEINAILSAPSRNRTQLLITTLSRMELRLRRGNELSNLSNQLVEVRDSQLKNLTQKFPTITANEIKLVKLLRLNLHSKQISELLNIGVHSAEIYRYRLRKKLNIPPKMSIVTYLQLLD
ncbi:MAG: tetratricopeptide repeat protein [Ignavibacteria bacterium]|nr:tetratricopeptide repeat protein [Ignavibacteria bacterium]